MMVGDRIFVTLGKKQTSTLKPEKNLILVTTG
jgi:hypothetical protein